MYPEKCNIGLYLCFLCNNNTPTVGGTQGVNTPHTYKYKYKSK